MKKTFLNIAVVAVIAAASFIACDKKQATDAANTVDSTAQAVDSAAQEATATVDSAAAAVDSAKAEAPKVEEAAKAEEAK